MRLVVASQHRPQALEREAAGGYEGWRGRRGERAGRAMTLVAYPPTLARLSGAGICCWQEA